MGPKCILCAKATFILSPYSRLVELGFFNKININLIFFGQNHDPVVTVIGGVNGQSIRGGTGIM